MVCRPCGTRYICGHFSPHYRAGLSHFATPRLILRGVDGAARSAFLVEYFYHYLEARMVVSLTRAPDAQSR
jgi:hypothetical protein